jgi:hypothetical protein
MAFSHDIENGRYARLAFKPRHPERSEGPLFDFAFWVLVIAPGPVEAGPAASPLDPAAFASAVASAVCLPCAAKLGVALAHLQRLRNVCSGIALGRLGWLPENT